MTQRGDVEKKVGSRRRPHRRDGQKPARGCSVDTLPFLVFVFASSKEKKRGGAKRVERASVAFNFRAEPTW